MDAVHLIAKIYEQLTLDFELPSIGRINPFI